MLADEECERGTLRDGRASSLKVLSGQLLVGSMLVKDSVDREMDACRLKARAHTENCTNLQRFNFVSKI